MKRSEATRAVCRFSPSLSKGFRASRPSHPRHCVPLADREIIERAAMIIQFNPAYHLRGGDQIHTPRQFSRDIDTKIFRLVPFIAIAQENRSGPPAAALIAAAQCPESVNELMMWVRLPVNRFASARYDNARAMIHSATFDLDCRRQVH